MPGARPQRAGGGALHDDDVDVEVGDDDAGEAVADADVAVEVGLPQLGAGDLPVEAGLDPVLQEVRVEGVADHRDGADEQADRQRW